MTRRPKPSAPPSSFRRALAAAETDLATPDTPTYARALYADSPKAQRAPTKREAARFKGMVAAYRPGLGGLV